MVFSPLCHLCAEVSVNLISASQAYATRTALRVLTFSLCSHSALTFLQDVMAPQFESNDTFGVVEPSIRRNV